MWFVVLILFYVLAFVFGRLQATTLHLSDGLFYPIALGLAAVGGYICIKLRFWKKD